MDCNLKDNKERNRYEYNAGGGHYGVVSYRRTVCGDIILIHTEVPEELAGKGVASQMMECVLKDISAQGKKVVPQCRFASTYIMRHPEWQRILEER